MGTQANARSRTERTTTARISTAAETATTSELQQPQDRQAEGSHQVSAQVTEETQGPAQSPDGADCACGKQALRLRLSAIEPASVLTTSFLILVGLGGCVLASLAAMWVLINILSPQGWPSLAEAAVLATGIVLLQTIIGTVIATSAAYLYNVSSEFTGGLEVLFADDPTSVARPKISQLAHNVLQQLLSKHFDTARGRAVEVAHAGKSLNYSPCMCGVGMADRGEVRF
ncbi:DUF3566 domain-containing protein [Streptomyces sp. MS2.AVA.5]|uniref:DUF3566 domain-containing protein n=1 Tax=Streptomyces achmelvichensis TaxID=3134111 RepID=A0ACC6Q7Z6_9ACTN